MGCGVVERHLEMAQPTKKTNKKTKVLFLNFAFLGLPNWRSILYYLPIVEYLVNDFSRTIKKTFWSIWSQLQSRAFVSI